MLQTVEQLPNVVQFFATQLPVVAEPVVEVPKILPHDVPPRRLCRDTQLVEQLVEVPTIVSWSLLQWIMEQNVGIPVPGGGGRSAGLQGFLPGQSSTSLHGPQERISERNVEQIAVSRVGEGLQDFSQDRVHPLLLAIQLVVLKLWMSLGTGFSHFSPNSKKCDTTSALEVGTASALEPMDAGCL